MIIEKGKVVAVEDDGVWVETANQSACSRCAARKGCGQSLLVQVDGHRSYIKAGYQSHSSREFREGDMISIGIDETAVLRGSLMVYCLPLLGLIGGASLASYLGVSELGSVAVAAAGLLSSALVVRWLSFRQRNNERYQPVVVEAAAQAAAVETLRVQGPGVDANTGTPL